MIVAVTPNAAWDVTYRTPDLRPGETHTVTVVSERAGGKGVNTAGVLTSMGVPCLAVAPVGHATIAAFAADLDHRGVPHLLVESPVTTRRCIAVVDEVGEATVLNEAGSRLPPAVLDGLVAATTRRLRPGDVVTVSGSLPPGSEPGLVAALTRAAHDAGARVVLDVRGPALRAALDERPDVVAPNRGEAQEVLGGPHEDAAGLARALVARGALTAVVSDGAAGAALVHGGTALSARPPRGLRGNPTGAGDALTASLAASLHGHGGLPAAAGEWEGVLRRGVAWSAAAVLRPVAGDLLPADVDRLVSLVQVGPTG